MGLLGFAVVGRKVLCGVVVGGSCCGRWAVVVASERYTQRGLRHLSFVLDALGLWCTVRGDQRGKVRGECPRVRARRGGLEPLVFIDSPQPNVRIARG